MSQYRNVTHNKLNYETGKWNSIYDVSGIKSKGYTFDISGQNIVLGVGTDKPFSRLSLGTDVSNGIFDPNKPGQLSAIALDESGNGYGFTGIVLNSKITSLDNNQITGLQIMSSTTDFSMNDITSTGKIILSNDNVTTIGGNSREKPSGYSNSNRGINIALDVRGSIRTDGYINFFDNSGSGQTPDGDIWDSEMPNGGTAVVPPGSLFLAAGGAYGPEGLYFKSTTDQILSVATNSDISNSVSTGEGGGAFDLSKNGGFGYILSKGFIDEQFGGVPVTINGKVWAPELSQTKSFNNALTIRDGNLAVITPSGQELTVINPPIDSHLDAATQEYFNDQSGGIILAEKQILLGKIGITDGTSSHRTGYGLIDIQSISTVPTILSTVGSTTTNFRTTSATNSIILLTRDPATSGQTSNNSNIGNIYDCNNTIIIGKESFKNINTPNSLISISNNSNTNTGSQIIDISGSNLVFGKDNDLSGSPFSIIFGSNNNIDNSNKTADSPEGKENVALGTDNNLYNSQNSFVDGTSNTNYGNLNVIFGNNNNLGSAFNQLGSNCFIQGNSNTIKAFPDISVNNAFIAGYNNQLDCDYSSFVKDTEDSHILLGSKAKISSDSSNVRFAFGTKAMEGNVFTIDISGNVEISGNLVVKGERTEIRTEFLDVSDNNLSLNYPGTNVPEGGGITLLDVNNGNKGLIWKSTPSIYGSDDYWHTSGSDISSNHIFANNIISNDISANDISCVDISATNFFSVGSSFFGDVHAIGASSFNDISANDISCVDISASTITLIGNKLYANNVAFTFPTTGGELGAQGQGAGAFPGIGTTSGKCYDGALGNDISNNVASNTGNISTNSSNITTNTASISSNTGNISTNSSNITTNTANISGKQPLITASTDLSVNDISCVDISATNFFSLGSSFFGDVHATGSSSFNDISATDISCVDISASSLTLVGNKLYANGKEFTFPSSAGGELSTGGGVENLTQWDDASFNVIDLSGDSTGSGILEYGHYNQRIKIKDRTTNGTGNNLVISAGQGKKGGTSNGYGGTLRLSGGLGDQTGPAIDTRSTGAIVLSSMLCLTDADFDTAPTHYSQGSSTPPGGYGSFVATRNLMQVVRGTDSNGNNLTRIDNINWRSTSSIGTILYLTRGYTDTGDITLHSNSPKDVDTGYPLYVNNGSTRTLKAKTGTGINPTAPGSIIGLMFYNNFWVEVSYHEGV